MKLAKLGDGPEIFHTIQGEGVSVGIPAVFIRASRCNLHCVWCDTDYTWNFEGTPWAHEKDANPLYAKPKKADVTYEIDPIDAAERILAFGCPRTVITGGEPLLQEVDFFKIIQHIRKHDAGHQFEVETNGTRLPSAAFYEAVQQFNISPKLTNSGMPEHLRVNAPALTFLAQSSKSWFKFVVAERPDLDEITEFRDRFGIPSQRILLMPEGRTAADLDQSAAWLADMCRERGFRFCDRLHIRIWGEKRGV